ncbi:hypothetical protein HU200_052254 [Digitaria exilis]|uniref:At1g61320/AtMIF1 LRR domain-containing protein n=1 Tax=Digitaria exilis TaxID=1010633 RepID=A0A835E8T8_9POAL|nr:hypothetical protein HU200_052254 [Digitaria exilis]
MPLRDAARAACLSHAFLRSWRCFPNLTFNEEALWSKARMYSGDFGDAVDNIMRNHSGIGVKILELWPFCIVDHNLNSWLQVAVIPGIEKLTLRLCPLSMKKYKFPLSLLSDGVRSTIRCLDLGFCTFHPTTELGPLRSLTSLHLLSVRIRGDELHGLLSNSLALACKLQRFSCLRICACERLKLIESKAPNLSTLYFSGKAKLSLGEALQMKKLSMWRSDVICYTRTELPSIMPNLDTLQLCSYDEVVDTPMLPTRFLCLKHLTIYLISGSSPYDYFSLVSFLEASPSLETLSLDMTADQHCYLKNVKITGFSSAKGLVELTCYILNNAVSLECLTLDTNYGTTRRCSDSGFGRCGSFGKSLREARRALRAIRTYIEDKVPARVKLTVVGPCSRCHKLS